MFCRNASDESSNAFSIYNVASKKKVYEALPFGRKNGQTLGFMSYGLKGDTLWVHDIVKDHFITMAHNGLDTASWTKLPVFYYWQQPLSKNLLLGIGDYYKDSYFKLSLTDVTNGKIVAQYLPYSKDTSIMWTRFQKMKNESFISLKPSSDKAIIASRYANKIEIIDLTNGSSKIIQGVENFEPQVDEMKGPDGVKIAVRTSKTSIVYLLVFSTDQYIYLLYSGKKDNGGIDVHKGNRIFVFDWNGNPKKELLLPTLIDKFTISSDNNKIYFYNAKTNTIQKADIL